MQMDHLFLLNNALDFESPLKKKFYDFFMLLSPFKFLNFLKLNFFLSFKNKFLQQSKVMFFIDKFLFPQKMRGLFLHNNKFFYNILFFQSNFLLKNFFFSSEMKSFILQNVNYIFKNPFFPECITFVFGTLNLKAQNLFDSNNFYLVNKLQFFEFLLFIFVECYFNYKIDRVSFFNLKSMVNYMDFFFFFC